MLGFVVVFIIACFIGVFFIIKEIVETVKFGFKKSKKSGWIALITIAVILILILFLYI